jgi:hypothetical protein
VTQGNYSIEIRDAPLQSASSNLFLVWGRIVCRWNLARNVGTILERTFVVDTEEFDHVMFFKHKYSLLSLTVRG